MNNSDLPFNGPQRDYQHDWELAMLARASYETKQRIVQMTANGYQGGDYVLADVLNGVENPRPIGTQMPPNWSLLGNDLTNAANFLDKNEERDSGLTVAAFEGPGNRIVIAFRGTDGMRDLISREKISGRPEPGADAALAADGDLLNELGASVKGETPKQQLAWLQQQAVPSWHRQFEEALDFVQQIRERYPNHEIEVTGHSLGGSIAQLVAHTYGLNGAAFDPAGAANLIESKGYKDWLAANGIEPKPLHADPNSLYARPQFANYLVNDSLVSEKSGPHLLAEGNTAISSLTGRQGLDEHASWVAGKLGARASDVVDALPIPPFLSSLPKGTARSVGAFGEALEYANALDKLGDAAQGATYFDAVNRHKMDRILRVFEDAMEKGKLNQFGQQPAPSDHDPVARVSDTPAKNSLDPTHKDHPDHALYSQSSKAVHNMEAALGRSPDQNSERMIASMLPLAKDGGLRCIDHVVLSVQTPKAAAGATVFAVQGELNDPAHLRAHMSSAKAIQTPTEDSFKQLEQVNQRLEQERVLAQNLPQPERERGQSLSMQM